MTTVIPFNKGARIDITQCEPGLIMLVDGTLAWLKADGTTEPVPATGGSQPTLQAADFTFEEQANGGVYEATLVLPPGSDVIGWHATTVQAPWAADIARLDIGDDINGPFVYTKAVALTTGYLELEYDPLDGGNTQKRQGRCNAQSGGSDSGSPFPITTVDQGAQKFTTTGEQTRYFQAGDTFDVSGSSGNDGTYTVASSTLTGGDTVITVVEAIPDATADGTINLPNTPDGGTYGFNGGNAFYTYEGYGQSVQYRTGGTITMRITTTNAAPVSPTGLLKVRILFVPPVTATDADFS